MSDITRKKDTGEPGNKGEFGHTPKAGSGLQLETTPAAEEHWVYIEREHGPDLAVGPYPTAGAAEQAMNESLLIDGFAEEDALDIWTEAGARHRGDPAFEEVIVDLDDPNHTGEEPTPIEQAERVLSEVRSRLVDAHHRKTGGWCKAHSDHGQQRCSEPALCDVAWALENLPQEPQGTMKSWMQAANGERIQTVQVENRTGKAWAPTDRVVDAAARATGVVLDGSIRDYRGMRVVGADDKVLVVTDDRHTVVYVRSTQPG